MDDEPADEVAMLEAFFAPTKREQYAEVLRSDAGRRKFIRELSSFTGFKASVIRSLPPSGHEPLDVAAALRARGATNDCDANSANRDLDRERLELESALKECVRKGRGTILICTPGRLGFYEGGGPQNRCILAVD
jgi:hypothetical protein